MKVDNITARKHLAMARAYFRRKVDPEAWRAYGLTRRDLNDGQAQRAIYVIRYGTADTIEMVENGVVALTAAAVAIRMARMAPHEVQEKWSADDIKKLAATWWSDSRDRRAAREAGGGTTRENRARRAPRIYIPYGRCQFPTAAEAGTPPPGSTLAMHDAFFERYGRVPLHPKTVKEMYECQTRTSMLVTQIVNISNARHPTAEEFFEALDQMLAWNPDPGKTNGEERDFARMAQASNALLKKHLSGAVDLLIGLSDGLDKRSRDNARIREPEMSG